MEYSRRGLKLTEDFEGCRLEAYLDCVKVPTIGYGHTKGVVIGDKCTQEQAEQWLIEDIHESERCVNNSVKIRVTQNQYDALVDFVFNLGAGNFQSSTLLKKLNSGDIMDAAFEFEKWKFAGGHVVAGLLRRRKAEKLLFLEPDDE